MTDVNDLLDTLDGLPLALAHAGSHLSRNTMPTRKYLEKYNQTFSKLVESQLKSTFDPSQRSIATTWTMSCESVAKEDAAAGTLLRLWGFFDPTDLFFALFTSLSVRMIEHLPRHIPKLADLLMNEDTFIEAMNLLVAYSLAAPMEDEGFYMHRVQHTWIRHTLIHQGLRPVMNSVSIKAVVTSMDQDTWDSERRLVPHARQQAHVLDQSLLKTHVHDLRVIAAFLKDWCVTEESQELYLLIRDVYHTAYGPHDDRTIDAQLEVSKGKENASDASPQQTDTTTTTDNLPPSRTNDPEKAVDDAYDRAQIYLRQGALSAAEEKFGEAIFECLWLHGMFDERTLHIADCHGVVLARLGRDPDAASILCSVHRHKVRLLGRNHPSTLSTLHHIAYLDLRSGHPERTINAEETFLDQRSKLRSTHPLILSATTVLAEAHRRLNHLSQAATFLEFAIRGRLKTLGPYHPTTLKTQDLFARLTTERQSYAQASDLYLRLIDGIDYVCRNRELSLDKTYELSRVQISLEDFQGAEESLEVCVRDGMDEGSYRHDLGCEWLQEITVLSGEMRRPRGWREWVGRVLR